MKRRFLRTLILLLAGGWLIVVAGGLRGLARYEARAGPGTAAKPGDDIAWPAGCAVVRDPALPTLIMFVHPMCPCSRASRGELARVMGRCAGRVRVKVVAVQPAGAPDDWGNSDLIENFRGIPGVNLLLDRGGQEARRFGARTSGQVNLYDPAGRLLFSGGITASRGHEGDNAGSDAVVSLVLGTGSGHQVAAGKSTPVYGCSLLDEPSSMSPALSGADLK